MTNLKISEGGFWKGISTTQPVWSFSGIVQWTCEFYPKSQITILVAQQLKLFQTNWKKFQTGGRIGAGFPTGVESMGGIPPIRSSKFDGGRAGFIQYMEGAWGTLNAVEKYLWRSSFVSKIAGYKPASLQMY